MQKEWKKPEVKDLDVEIGVLAKSPAATKPPGLPPLEDEIK
jgi:hypothetical protein